MKAPKPFIISKRKDSKTFQLTLNISCGLPARVCVEWRRRSFQNFPDELSQHKYPKTKVVADAGAYALITYLKKRIEEGNVQRISSENVTVGSWIEKFTHIATSPRTGLNAAKNRPYSPDTVISYRCYYDNHIKNDIFCSLKMSEVEEEDSLEYISRLSLKKLGNNKPMSGSRTFAGVIVFIRMAFLEYQKKNKKWFNPFLNIDPPIIKKKPRDALPESEVIKLFVPGVLNRTMELAVCAAMFLSGLRRSEIFALKPADLDWATPKLTVCMAWQNFDHADKILGPPKGKCVRNAPFDPILQEAIKKLWEENGQHEYVFSWKDGSIPGSTWIYLNFPKWLKRAGISLNGRNIVPHSARHSLASLLEEKGVSIRYIQELLGHSDLETTKMYLHSTEKTIRDIGKKISDVMGGKEAAKNEETKIINFNVS
ncbi:MAG: site-specific integrase [Treponema sp.]|jgi:integrase/recombinase XerD|nr:site-specific integrase [Treponema sp.]